MNRSATTYSVYLILFLALLQVGCSTLGNEMSATESEPVPPEQQTEAGNCESGPLRKVLVTSFPLRYPEQIRPGEYMAWGQTTGASVAGQLQHNARLRVINASQRFPFANSFDAPQLARDKQGKALILSWAAADKAQYVVAGVLRDFGQSRKWGLLPERQMVIDAYIFDAADASLLHQAEFNRSILLNGDLPASITPGTHAFASSRLGENYHGLIEEIARWAEDSITCQPFRSRIIKVDGRRLTLDAGRDSGIEKGMSLAMQPASNSADTQMARGRQRPAAVVVEIHADHSIAEVPQQRNPPTFLPGGMLYVSGK